MTKTSKTVLILMAGACLLNAQAVDNPYRCEGDAQNTARGLSLREIKSAADALYNRKSAWESCIAAELYKRIGDPMARAAYEKAIARAPEEPAYELLYGDYLRLYRGAGQRPLFPAAEIHLHAARAKLLKILKETGAFPPCHKTTWNQCTADRVQRSLTALYERDGFHLASWTWRGDQSRADVGRPWLFFSPGMRWEQSNNDFDRTSDIRDRTSEAVFSASRLRQNRPLTQAELDSLVRLMTPLEGTGRVRIRYESAPILDIFVTDRRTGDAQVTNFFQPGRFNRLKLLDFGASLEKPFAISGNTDGVARFAYHHIHREGLIEFLPEAAERINQFEVSGALSHYLGPDRLNLSYTYVRQIIDPEPANQLNRDREIMGGTATYQLFRTLPLPGRSLETGLGRRFETRGIDLFGGAMNDDEKYPGGTADVLVTRRDYFVGIAARGLRRMDVTVQPTWYTSSVSNDASQYNSQMRTQGNLLFRILDEERTGGIPKERFFGLPVAFVQIVVPFHYDTPRQGSEVFRSRRVGAELWTKYFSKSDIGVTILSVAGYSRQWFPGLNREVNLARVGFSIGF